ncbi:PD-(D/E)XK nuclease family protein [Sinimarinibacterium thermocellulolyticum]|uniref:PD-(D/E)XK nuclease family protein n=1 Tax=Sinimarinibacterium thermocellulolyticum TaxID=3170016 RepID=A0ABV2A8F9_9GAMM
MRISDLRSMERAALFERLSHADTADTLVLCVSPRLVQHLQTAYARWQAARGMRTWRTPAIHTAETWLQARADTLGVPEAQARGLSAARTELLWRLIVHESREDFTILHEGAAARAAAQAWRLCADYELAPPLPASSPEIEAYNRWARQYQERCAKLGCRDAAQLRADTIAALATAPALPGTIVLAGFETILPWQQRMLAALRDRRCELLRLDAQAQTASVSAVCAPTAEQELLAAALWVAERARRTPDERIGVIVPDLHARRAELIRVFDQVLCPAFDTLSAGSAVRPYNLSLGEPLVHFGLVHCALLLLQLLAEGLDLPAAGALLCSPYWGAGETDATERAELDRRARAQGHLRLDLATLMQLARDRDRLRAALARLPRLSTLHRADLPTWADRFSEALDAAGWPGPRTLDSAEFQALEAWRDLLAELGALEDVLGPVSASVALAQLRHLAGERIFQPQTPPLNIQVLGALEAQGLDFDALWVMGLDDESWPPAGRPNPFIPFDLQRRLGMPHASTMQELAWAERTTQNWRAAAGEVVFSWAASDGDRPLSPSPLIRDEAARAQRLPPTSGPQHWQAMRAAAELETLTDVYAPRPDPQLPLPGGTRLLADQATCPFRAFASHRLGAAALEEPGYGPNPIDRGLLAHRTLETLWRNWRHHGALAALDDAALDEAIAAAVDTELDRAAARAPQRFAPRMRSLEARRLRALLRTFLEIERERPPFSVEIIEGEPLDAETPGISERSFGGLRLRLRPDRIDRLDDGRRLVIDYKTGAARKPPWRDGRPEEPQLLLYALTEPDIDGIAYARLRVGEVGFDGLAASDEIAPGIKPYERERDTRDAASWSALMGRWRGQLETVAEEIGRGLASVTPKHPRQSCRDCQLHALCRVRESAPWAAAADEEVLP